MRLTEGDIAAGFEAVADAFERNFAERGDVGAAFAAYVGQRKVVDLWGGVADRQGNTPWRADTLAVLFSGTKGLVAACLLVLIDRGELDLDSPVAAYWPEFGQRGKGATLVRHVVSHTAGVPGLETPVEYRDVLSHEYVCRLLEQQEPFWPPGTVICYHALTYGWLCSELVRRVDGRTAGRFFRDEIARPLSLDAWIGLPDDLEPRVATVCLGSGWDGVARDSAEQDPRARAVYRNPERFFEPLPANTREARVAEVPAANGIATARAVARMYTCLAQDGELDGVRLMSAKSVQLGRTCLARGDDPFLKSPLAFGVGFGLQTAERPFGPPLDAFGHGGAGGSIHGAWPSLGVGFSYVMNELRDEQEPDPRGQALLAALHDCVMRAQHND